MPTVSGTAAAMNLRNVAAATLEGRARVPGTRGPAKGARRTWMIFVKGNNRAYELKEGWMGEVIDYMNKEGYKNFMLRVSKGGDLSTKEEAKQCLKLGVVHLAKTEAEASVIVRWAATHECKKEE